MPTHRRRRAAAALGVTALLVLSACGGDDGDDEAEDAATTEEEASDATQAEVADDDPDEGETTTSPEPDDEGDDEGDDDDGGSPSDLESLLLTTDDLPDGWEEQPSDDDPADDAAMDDDEGFCEGQPVDGFAAPPEDVERSFAYAEEGTGFSFYTIASTAGRFDGDGAEAFIEAVRDEYARCEGQAPADDSFLTEATTLEDLGGIGDDAVALETVEEDGIFGLYVARADDVIMFVFLLAETGQVDGEELLRTMADRA